MKKIIDELINNSIRGVDVYRYNDATWLIFTDETRWVVEMTDGGTLWYNYKFFNDIMRYVSMDPKEYEGYITGWANDYFFKDIKKSRMGIPIDGEWAADTVINKGINKTERSDLEVGWHTREVINDGVKEVRDSSSTHRQNRADNLMSRIIQGGIKNTYPDQMSGDEGYNWSNEFEADKVIERGDKDIRIPPDGNSLRS